MFDYTTTPLTGAGTVTLGPRPSLRYDSITGTVFSDQGGTLYIEQSADGTNYDVSTSYTITANDGKGFSEPVVAGKWRVRYVNGATPQGTFRLFVGTRSAGNDA